MSSFDTGLSGLNAAQRAMDVIGNNLANANTPGYHRQVADLDSRAPYQLGNLQIGTGVQVTDIEREQSSLLDQAITTQTFQAADTTAQLNTLQQVQAAFGPDGSTLQNSIEGFFNQLTQLASNPQDSTLRQVVVGNAQSLTQTFNTLGSSLDNLQGSLNTQLGNLVTQINSETQQIAGLNSAIQQASAQGINANDLLDQRDQLINQLAGQVGVQVVPQDFNQVAVIAAGTAVVAGGQSTALQFSVDANDQATFTAAGSSTALPVSGGQAGGLMAIRNSVLPGYQKQLDTLAGSLAQQVNGIQATGLGLSGPQTFLSGQNAVSNINVPLDKAGLAFPPQAGTLYVSVTNQATGDRSLSQITIDPTTQSLSDVAAALSGIANLQAVADPQTGTLQIMAKPGYAFDFAGQPQPSPSTAGITGTTQPQIGGQYTGTSNDIYTFQVLGSGTVGQTPNLQMQVKDSAGDNLATLNVGQGYSPGTPLQVANGLTVQLSAGTANAGDTFSSTVVGQPDTAGILTALGLNTFFTGSTADDLKVSPALVSNPNLLAASQTGQPGDGSNLARMIALQTQPLMNGGTQTFTQAANGLVGDVGTQIQQLTAQQQTQTALGQQLQAQQQSVAGVDPNEELVQLLSFQRSFQAAAKYISTVNDTLNQLFQLFA